MTGLRRYRPIPQGTHPPNDFVEYGSTKLRHPKQAPVSIPQTLSEITGPVSGFERFGPVEIDLTMQHEAPAQGERIIIEGRVLDEDGKPIPHTLVELWQANAAGRYRHDADQHDAPLDPNFSGAGRAVTDAEGRYRFVTIKPGAYPWRNHANAWRPAHLHFSLFGPSFLTRLVTQMYFPGDPLLRHDPIFNSLSDEAARARMIAAFDFSLAKPEWALGYRFDMILRGRHATPTEVEA
ncbi:MAG: protocatechuate 3,4-dioxygenase subunit beta [Alphaproteobacteria bacterium]|nr:protocatechuate 3,4-dioxygenase subunit beta [Alphaproteobacteria bacterium]